MIFQMDDVDTIDELPPLQTERPILQLEREMGTSACCDELFAAALIICDEERLSNRKLSESEKKAIVDKRAKARLEEYLTELQKLAKVTRPKGAAYMSDKPLI